MTAAIEYPDGATPLDPDELDGLKYKHIATRSQLDELEQVNIEQGLRWLERQRRKDILSDDFAITLHKRLFGDVWTWAGTFRLTGKNIGIDPIHIAVRLRDLMDTGQYWVDHKSYEPIEAAVRLHHKLVYIHPFPNGNGRHARILADTVLKRIYGADPVDWAGDDNLQQMNDRRAAYIAALKAADGEDYEPLLTFVGFKP